MYEPSNHDLETELSSLPDGNPSGHPDDLVLAAWLDGILGSAAAAAVEEHLAACARCRSIVADAGSESGPSRRRFQWRRLVAVAALLVVAVAGWRLLTWDARLGRLGLPWWQSLTRPGVVDSAVDALAGDWPRVSDFERFRDSSGRALLRGAEAPRAPEPLAPRWSSVRESRPTLRLYSSAERLQILVVDSDEQVAAAFEIHQPSRQQSLPGGLEPGGPETSRIVEVPWPDTAASLLPGVYAWRAQALHGELEGSAWVPFRVLDQATLVGLEGKLRAGAPMASALALAELGLIDEAAGSLAAIDDPDLLRLLLGGLLARRDLPAALARLELEAGLSARESGRPTQR